MLKGTDTRASFHSWETGFNADLLGAALHSSSFKAFTTQMVGSAGLIRREGVLGRQVEGIFLGSQNLGEPIKSQRPAHSTCVSALNLDWIFWWHKRVSASCHWGVGTHSPTLLSPHIPPSSIQLAPALPEEQAARPASPDWPSVPSEGEGPTCPRASQGCWCSCPGKILKPVFSWMSLIRCRCWWNDFSHCQKARPSLQSLPVPENNIG